MAVLTPTKGETSTTMQVWTWEGATNGGTPDTFTAIKIDKMTSWLEVQTSGNYSGSASVALHGSLDGTNYAALADITGTAIAHTAAAMSSVGSLPLWIKPVLSSGDGSADIDATVMIRF